MTSVLITGCSSGYGLATAQKFLDEGWNVVATMRTPREDVLPRSDRLKIVALDVTDPDSIANAIRTAGPIDVLVNNAGGLNARAELCDDAYLAAGQQTVSDTCNKGRPGLPSKCKSSCAAVFNSFYAQCSSKLDQVSASPLALPH